MNLQQKLDNFNQGTLLVDETLSLDTLSAHKVTLKSRNANIRFEKNVMFHSTVLPTKDMVFLGAYSYMNEDGYVRGPVFIGRFCSIGRRVSIGAGMHSFSGLSSHPLLSSDSVRGHYSDEELVNLGLKDQRPVGVVIGSDVWIGDGVVILPGVTIGEGSIIGANAVVNKNIEPYSIVAGMPARFLRRRFLQNICVELHASRWWEYDLDVVRSRNYKNVGKFLSGRIAEETMAHYPTLSFER